MASTALTNSNVLHKHPKQCYVYVFYVDKVVIYSLILC